MAAPHQQRHGEERGTVENHISHILDKLGVDNRTRIATWSETRGSS
jgi:DNA-binding NarL/FixJ family response regulator